MSFILRFIQNNPYSSAIMGTIAACTPALYSQASANPYSFGAQILSIGLILAANHYIERRVAGEPIIVMQGNARAAAIAAHHFQHVAQAAPSRVQLPELQQPQRTPLYPELKSGISFSPALNSAPAAAHEKPEKDPISQEEIPPEHRIEMESGGVFDDRQLFFAMISATKMINSDGIAYLQNPLNRNPFTSVDIATLCDRFLIEPRSFLDLWDTASSVVGDTMLSTGNTEEILISQEDHIGNAERTFRTDSAIELVRQNALVLADQLLETRK